MAISIRRSGDTQADSMFDFDKLATLKRELSQSPDNGAQQKKVATQFEAVYLQMMIKRMREATPKEGLFDTQQTQMMQSMVDEQLALQLAAPGVGLAQALLRQMQAPSGEPQSSRLLQSPSEQTKSRREVNALLNVLRHNRALDKVQAAAEGAPDHVVDFVSRLAPAANAAAQKSGVPARLIMGQAALESGWGKREILMPDGSRSHNLFGIKAGANWKGQVVNVMTTEYVGDKAEKLMQPFRAYASYEEAFSDYANVIASNTRYEQVTQARDEFDAARRIQDAGYATDPRYAEKLIRIMGQLRLSVAREDSSLDL